MEVYGPRDLDFNNKSMALGFLKNQKEASNTIYHPALLYKLSKLEFVASIIQFIGYFLSDITFEVSDKGETSMMKEIKVGMPQCTILSPILHKLHKTFTT
jgi:hypothetical protein